MSNYIRTGQPQLREALGCQDTISQALGACCPACAKGRPCQGTALGATDAKSSLIFMGGAALVLWWALFRKGTPKRRRNPSPRLPRKRRRAKFRSGRIGHLSRIPFADMLGRDLLYIMKYSRSERRRKSAELEYKARKARRKRKLSYARLQGKEASTAARRYMNRLRK